MGDFNPMGFELRWYKGFWTRLESLVNDGFKAISRVAQRKRAGPITQRSEDRNLPLLHKL